MNLLPAKGSRARTLQISAALYLCVVSGCTDGPITAPAPDAQVVLTPATQWAGGVVEAHSSVFRDLDLIWATDSTGAVRPNRYTNVAVIVDGDTVDSWQTGTEEMSFRLPNPKLTGLTTVQVTAAGRNTSPADIEVIGSPWPASIVECGSEPGCRQPFLESYGDGPYRFDYHGVGLPNGNLLAFFGTASVGVGGIGMANLAGPEPTADLLPAFRVADWQQDGMPPGLVAPGDAVGPQEWILDASPYTAPIQPTVWRVGPPLAPVRLLDCLPDGMPGVYTVAELPTGECFVLTRSAEDAGGLLVNGIAPVPGYETIPRGWTAGCATFRSSPGNRWITLRAMEGPDLCGEANPAGLPAWPVFNADGDLSFSSTRYLRWVRGADFTPTGDTLWIVGATPDWSLDAWNPTTGELMFELSLPDFAHCDDVLVDPIRPYVYAACRRHHPHLSGYANWPSLIVFNRHTFSVVAVLNSMPPYRTALFSPTTLVYGGSSGQVHLTGVRTGITAPVDRGIWVLSWDIR